MCLMGGSPSILLTLGLPRCRVSGRPDAQGRLSQAMYPSLKEMQIWTRYFAIICSGRVRQHSLTSILTIEVYSRLHCHFELTFWTRAYRQRVVICISEDSKLNQGMRKRQKLWAVPGRLPHDSTEPEFVRAMQNVPPAATSLAPPSRSKAYNCRMSLMLTCLDNSTAQTSTSQILSSELQIMMGIATVILLWCLALEL